MRHRAAIVGAMLCIAVAAASGRRAKEGATSSKVEPSLGPLPPVVSAAGVSLPLEAYLQTPEQELLDAQAGALLIRDCMSSHGETWNGDNMAEAVALNKRAEAQRALR